MRVLLHPCMCLAKHASNFVHFVVGSLKSGKELATLYSGIFVAKEKKKKEFLPQRCTRGLLCFGNSTQHPFMLPRVVEAWYIGKEKVQRSCNRDRLNKRRRLII